MAMQIVYPAPDYTRYNTLSDIMKDRQNEEINKQTIKSNEQVMTSNAIRNKVLQMKLDEGIADKAIEEEVGNAILRAGGQTPQEAFGGGQQPGQTAAPAPAPGPNGPQDVNPNTVEIDQNVAAANPGAFARRQMAIQKWKEEEGKRRGDFYRELSDDAIKAGDNVALQKIIGSMRNDPFIAPRLPKGFNLEVQPDAISVTAELNQDQLKSLASGIDDEDLATAVENMPPGLIEVKKKKGKIVEVKVAKEKSKTLMDLAKDMATRARRDAGDPTEPSPQEIADAYKTLQVERDPLSVAIRHVTGGKDIKWVELGKKQQDEVLKVMGNPTFARATATMAAQGDLYSDETMKQAYEYMKATGKPRPEDLRLAFRFPGALAKLQDYISKRAAKEGWSGADRAFTELKYRALGTEYMTTARMKALTSRYEGMLRLNTGVLRQENMKMLRSRFPDFNKVKQMIAKKTGDADIMAFEAQLGRVAVEWAKVSSGSLGVAEPSVEAQKRMNEMLAASNSWDQLEAQIDTILLDAGHATKSFYEREKQQREDLYTGAGMPVPEVKDLRSRKAKVKVGRMMIETELPTEIADTMEKNDKQSGSNKIEMKF